MDNKLSPRVSQLIADLSIQILTREEWLATYKVDEFSKNTTKNANGSYSAIEDLIIVNHELMDSPNRTILHEVGHWTGHISRIARPLFLLAQKAHNSGLDYIPYEWAPKGEDATEELVAEIFSIKMQALLGLSNIASDLESGEYLYFFKSQGGNFELAKKRADEAIQYVETILAQNEKKAA